MRNAPVPPDTEAITPDAIVEAHSRLQAIAADPGGEWAILVLDHWTQAMERACDHAERALLFRNCIAGFLQLLGHAEIDRLNREGKFSDPMAQAICVVIREATQFSEQMKADDDDKEAGVIV